MNPDWYLGINPLKQYRGIYYFLGRFNLWYFVDPQDIPWTLSGRHTEAECLKDIDQYLEEAIQ